MGTWNPKGFQTLSQTRRLDSCQDLLLQSRTKEVGGGEFTFSSLMERCVLRYTVSVGKVSLEKRGVFKLFSPKGVEVPFGRIGGFNV